MIRLLWGYLFISSPYYSWSKPGWNAEAPILFIKHFPPMFIFVISNLGQLNSFPEKITTWQKEKISIRQRLPG